DLHDQRSDDILLENYYKELQSLILESPALKMDSEIHQQRLLEKKLNGLYLILQRDRRIGEEWGSSCLQQPW
ncbi:unnamed protein product, partial [Ilex paraguariensis]